MVHIVAILKALLLFASTIGINKISGGIGKKELSIKEIIAKKYMADFLFDNDKTLLYIFRNIAV
jgi:hypothetical protein